MIEYDWIKWFYTSQTFSVFIRPSAILLCMVLPPVTALSDSDCEQTPGPAFAAEPSEPRQKEQKRGVKRLADPHLRARLGRLGQSLCYCSRAKSRRPSSSCFLKFQGRLDDVYQLRAEIAALHKFDADHKVPFFNIYVRFWLGGFCFRCFNWFWSRTS